jgi:hypothetical protein
MNGKTRKAFTRMPRSAVFVAKKPGFRQDARKRLSGICEKHGLGQDIILSQKPRMNLIEYLALKKVPGNLAAEIMRLRKRLY